MLFPKFQVITWLTLLAFTVGTVLFDKEWLDYRHSLSITGMLKIVVPRVVVSVIGIILLFFSIYLKMVAEYSA